MMSKTWSCASGMRLSVPQRATTQETISYPGGYRSISPTGHRVLQPLADCATQRLLDIVVVDRLREIRVLRGFGRTHEEDGEAEPR